MLSLKKTPWYSWSHDNWVDSGRLYAYVGNTSYLFRGKDYRLSRYLGLKHYELTDHLGNVNVAVLDKISGTGTGNAGEYAYLSANISSFNDYYPFGMPMPERNGSLEKYRFGFNGQEKDNEIKGDGNQVDFKFRAYDTRLGRFMAVDPLTSSYPYYTPYQFAGNDVIRSIDLEGAQPKIMIDKNGKLTSPMVSLINSAFLFSKSSLQKATWVPYTRNARTRIWANFTHIPKTTAASVLLEKVIYNPDLKYSNEQWLGLIVHEQSHEYDLEGRKFSFYANYAIEAVQSGYRQVTTERIAYNFGSNHGSWDYSDELVTYRNGVILSILENKGLSNSFKEQQMERFGSLFRRDVIIPNEMRKLYVLIGQTELRLKDPLLSKEHKKLLNITIDGMNKTLKKYRNESKEITREYGE